MGYVAYKVGRRNFLLITLFQTTAIFNDRTAFAAKRNVDFAAIKLLLRLDAHVEWAHNWKVAVKTLPKALR